MKEIEYFKFNGALLDNYLAAGYYRMGQYIFTTDSIFHNGKNCPVFWLRYPLHNFYFAKKPGKLLAANSHFKITIKDFSITQEIQDLYALYFDKTNFDAPPTMQSFLFGEPFIEQYEINLFDSEAIEIRDGNKLVAIGIYDRGENSIAGIMNFFDPAYKKHSPGKYLMLLKMQHATSMQLQYYYPGYIAYGYEKFNYKLFPNPALAEIFDSKNKYWLPYNKILLEQLVENFSEQMK